MSKKESKVYCSQCKWFNIRGICNHISNLKDTYLEPNGEWIGRPENLNANNDCINFNCAKSERE